MAFFWGIVTGYTYCVQSSAVGTVAYLPTGTEQPQTLGVQIVGTLLLLIAAAVLIYATKRSASSKTVATGTLVGVLLTIIAGLVQWFAIYNVQEFDPWVSRYAFGVGIYTFGYTLAFVPFLIHLVLHLMTRQIRLIRHLAVLFYVCLTFNWSFFTIAVIGCS